ncbi:MAG: lysylphosphatidylglycerol synthase domain-containing protein, partial [Candidatus Binataceae bacterium]
DAPASAESPDTIAAARAPLWRRAIPYLVTLLIFGLIFWRIPIREVAEALKNVPAASFIGIFLPFSLFYFAIDAFCLTWVVRRFNAPVRYAEVMPIRASMYLLAMVNTNLGQGGVAYYLYRKMGIPFLEALSSVLFIALAEIYQLFLFSTLGVLFYSPQDRQLVEVTHLLRIAYVVAWVLFFAIIGLFAVARRNEPVRRWIESSRMGAVAGTFLKARPLDYLLVLAIKSPTFLGSLVVQFFALSLYGISVSFLKLVLFLPLVFLAAALPITVAHLGTSQAAWLLFFSDNAAPPAILAYSLAAHFTFMFCNGLIGLCFLRRAARELAA